MEAAVHMRAQICTLYGNPLSAELTMA